MKTIRTLLATAAVALQLSAAHAVLLTNDTALSPTDVWLDGQDVVISNCTVTIDGPHTLSNLQVAGGGVLTHARWGTYPTTLHVSNETQVLSGTNAVTLTGTNIVLTSIAVSDAGGTSIFTNDVDYSVVPRPDGMTDLRRTTQSAIGDGASVLVSYDVPAPQPGLNLTVAGDIEVAAAGAIRVDGQGYGGGSGPAPGVNGAGGGHGGAGGRSSRQTTGGPSFGYVDSPRTIASGGGSGTSGFGGAGGGILRLNAGGKLLIDGIISANGEHATNSGSGGGAGGSIWLTAASVSGSGLISADGGNGEPSLGGGGGGGRIELEFFVKNSFAGALRAFGGNGYQRGGAGTVYVRPWAFGNGSVVVNNGGVSGATTDLLGTNLFDLTIGGGAIVFPSGIQTASSLTIESNAWISCLSSAGTVLPPGSINLKVSGDARIFAGGGIDAAGKGYSFGQGLAPGTAFVAGLYGAAGGGGHGGYGGAGAFTNSSRGGISVGIPSQPMIAGSGGGGTASYPGGSGGGVVKLTVDGTLTVDGYIAADGQNSPSNFGAGGAGGAIWLTTGSLMGSGTISANGGSSGSSSGGGAGGRIATYSMTSDFTGKITAFGGSGFQPGSAGTVYSKLTGKTNEALLVDNGGRLGTNTPFSGASTIDLTVQRGAFVQGVTVLNSLTIRSNSGVILSGSTQLTLSIGRDVTVEPGGSISADGGGQPGQGYGRFSDVSAYSGAGGGGGYGGYGGNGYLSTVAPSYTAGGVAYASSTIHSPTQMGSPGGGSIYAVAGIGGGAVRLVIGGSLQLDGTISANGLPGRNGGAGGGSGGSIWINVDRWTGAGVLCANGGAGDMPSGGGGGGGRIAVYCTGTNLFSGTVATYGGIGANVGGAGSIYIQNPERRYPLVVLDNAGQSGGASAVTFGGNRPDLVLRGGAILTNSTGLVTLQSLLVSSNSWIWSAIGTYGSTIAVAENTIIELGGGIIGDGTSVNPGGRFWPYTPTCGGGGAGFGSGGIGGAGIANSGGATAAYGSVVDPNRVGSAGGTSSQTSNPTRESLGGGALRLQVDGTLQADGVISMNGNPGTSNGAGGGGGGSVSLIVRSISGSGSISANGGDADLPYGGGGGGGAISISFRDTNSFSGTVSAKGGKGFVAGGAGIIHLQSTTPYREQVIVDAGGLPGTNTLVQMPGLTADLIVKGGAKVLPLLPATARSLEVFPDSELVVSNVSRGLQVTGDAFIHAGGLVHANGLGYPAGAGQGAGTSWGLARGGGSHGGLGGANPYATASDGVDARGAAGWGSGGGSASNPSGVGGSGGGNVTLSVAGSLTVNGRVSADGMPGSYESGGGAGGFVSLSASVFDGTGMISANGGAGQGAGGGGGGGRVAIRVSTNLFTGSFTAFGGTGFGAGGAGTVYVEQTGLPKKSLVVDNGSLKGTNTPLYALPDGLDLFIANGANAIPQGSVPLFNSLTVGTGGVFTASSRTATLFVSALRDIVVQPGGSLTVDGSGYYGSGGSGPGATSLGQGAGAGHGGRGGSTMSGAIGGITYDSESEPVENGSGGGGNALQGSEGGGVIRLKAGGTLHVEGALTANGKAGVAENSGGGSGGSIWATAGAVTGSGIISAFGGDGEPFDGGGGGGGRIAIYSPSNSFAGTISVLGGNGTFPGKPGTVYNSASLPALTIMSQTPVGLVSNVVTSVDLTFSEALDPGTVSTDDFAVTGPGGPLPVTSAATTDPYSLRLILPAKNLVGEYRVEAGPGIQNIFGTPMSQVYTGVFSITLPLISGKVTDVQGQPVAGVMLQPTGELVPSVTDESGSYTLALPRGWSGSIYPEYGSNVFLPTRSLFSSAVESDMPNSNHVMYATLSPQVGLSSITSSNVVVEWQGVAGVYYSVLWSSDLQAWRLVSSPDSGIPGTDGPMSTTVLVGTNSPVNFYRVFVGVPQ